MAKKHPDNRKKNESEPNDPKTPRGTDQGRRESPRSHEEAPGRNPAPTRPAGDEPSRSRRDGEEPERDNEPDDNQER